MSLVPYVIEQTGRGDYKHYSSYYRLYPTQTTCIGIGKLI